jgi:hypothetical protein
MVYQLIPNVKQLEDTLANFTGIIDADEVLLFEKATFLVCTVFTYCSIICFLCVLNN